MIGHRHMLEETSSSLFLLALEDEEVCHLLGHILHSSVNMSHTGFLWLLAQTLQLNEIKFISNRYKLSYPFQAWPDIRARRWTLFLGHLSACRAQLGQSVCWQYIEMIYWHDEPARVHDDHFVALDSIFIYRYNLHHKYYLCSAKAWIQIVSSIEGITEWTSRKRSLLPLSRRFISHCRVRFEFVRHFLNTKKQ